MNTLTIIVLLALAVFALNGYMKGFVKTLTSMLFFVLTAVLVYYATPYVSSFLKTKTPVYNIVEQQCAKLVEGIVLSGDLEESGNEDETQQDVPRARQSEIIKALPLPKSLQTELLDNNNSFSYEHLAAQTFGQYIAKYLASLILNIVTYMIAFILISILLRVTIMTLDVITNLPVLHGINQVLGLGLGLLQGVAAVWLAFLQIRR